MPFQSPTRFTIRPDLRSKPEVLRIEVFTCAGGRQRWSCQAKAQIVAESWTTSMGEAVERGFRVT